MRRILKLSKWVLIALLISFVALFSLAYLFSDAVKTIVVNEVNKNLEAEVEVENISFSFLTHFPYASVNFQAVKILEPESFQTTGMILSGSQLSLLFNPIEIFFKNYNLKKIKLKDATLNLQVKDEGVTNYEFWKTDHDSSAQNFSIELNEVLFENVDVLYYNSNNDQDHHFIIKKGNLSGAFQESQFSISSSFDLYVEKLLVDSTNYLSEKDCELNLQILVDHKVNSYTIQDSELTLSRLTANVDGVIIDKFEEIDIDLNITSKNADIPELISALPTSLTLRANEFDYSGSVDFSCRVFGLSSAIITPEIELDFKSENSSITPKGTKYKLSNIRVDGRFLSSKSTSNPVEYLDLKSFDATLEGKPITGSLTLENFKRPLINLSANFEADLSALTKFYIPDTLEYLKGNANATIEFQGIAGEESTYKSNGNISISEVGFKLKKKPVTFENIGGMLHLKGNDIIIDQLIATIGKSDFIFSGSFDNLVGWLLKEGTKLRIKANVASNFMDLDELLSNESESNEDTTPFRIYFSENLELDLDVKIASFQFRKFNATDIIGEVSLYDKTLQTRSLTFNTASGSSHLTGRISDLPGDSLKIDYNARVKNLDITKLFYEMGNFGQKVITDENLKGRVTADVLLRSMWSKTLEVNIKSIMATSNFTIENGELLNFAPMLELQDFLKGSDLYQIKFSTLTNAIDIRDEKIFIPLMEIKSTALDLKASGIHRFDNVVDYKLRLYLSQIMGRKVKDMNSEFGTIEEDGYGRPMIFLSMKGPINEPVFKYDRKAVEEKITEDIKKEAQTLKQIFKQEFGKKDKFN
jgi:uncharacterized protein involved in outer membrane biogenesis